MKLETLPEDGAAPHNYVELVKYIENTLGWTWNWEDTRPAWKIRAEQAGRIKKAAKKGVRGKRNLEVADLVATVDWMRERRITVEHPAAILYYVERALKDARDDGVASPTLVNRETALAEIQDSDGSDEVKVEWTRRVTRAGPGALADVLAEWRER